MSAFPFIHSCFLHRVEACVCVQKINRANCQFENSVLCSWGAPISASIKEMIKRANAFV